MRDHYPNGNIGPWAYSADMDCVPEEEMIAEAVAKAQIEEWRMAREDPYPHYIKGQNWDDGTLLLRYDDEERYMIIEESGKESVSARGSKESFRINTCRIPTPEAEAMIAEAKARAEKKPDQPKGCRGCRHYDEGAWNECRAGLINTSEACLKHTGRLPDLPPKPTNGYL